LGRPRPSTLYVAAEKWHDMKFGLRIHWGEYAIDAIGPESWPLNNAKGNQSFLNWYWHQNETWSPKKYDPDAWIALMKRAGVTFFDFTTKHHEGFSMYDTATRVHDCWDLDLTEGAKKVKGIVPCLENDGNGSFDKPDGIAYSSMEAFGRDVTGELVAAARRGGIIPGELTSIQWIHTFRWMFTECGIVPSFAARRAIFFQH
jgi:alpha-L-fucosidase